MLLAIISDTHLPRGQRSRLPKSCVHRLRAADHVLHAGDLTSLTALDELLALGRPLTAVHGNVDVAAVRERLPGQVEIELDGVRLAMVHDGGPSAGRARRLRARFPGAQAVIFGHSHIPLLEEREGVQIFNPGSPTERRRSPQHTMGLARIADAAIAFDHVSLGP